jgi:NTP pyrophosphatase (non-canonical NTP hydrolase)
MDFKTYQVNAIRTIKWMGMENWDRAHMALGMASELGELIEAIQKQDSVGVSEEIADIMWYVANEATIMKYSIVLQSDVSTYGLTSITKAVSDYCDIVKKTLVYNKEYTKEEQVKKLQKVADVCFNFMYINTAVGTLGTNADVVKAVNNDGKVDLLRALDNNIAKLKKRYPDKYTDHNALNRDLDAERTELEK